MTRICDTDKRNEPKKRNHGDDNEKDPGSWFWLHPAFILDEVLPPGIGFLSVSHVCVCKATRLGCMALLGCIFKLLIILIDLAYFEFRLISTIELPFEESLGDIG